MPAVQQLVLLPLSGPPQPQAYTASQFRSLRRAPGRLDHRPVHIVIVSSWVVSGRRAAKGSTPHLDTHEVASKEVWKPRSTAARRSEDQAKAGSFSHAGRPEDLRRTFFSYMPDGAFKPISHKDFAEWPVGHRTPGPGNFALHTPKAQLNKA